MKEHKFGASRLASAAGALAAGLGGAQSLDAAVVFQAVDVDIPADMNEYHVDLNGDATNEFDIQLSDDLLRIKATDYGATAGTLRAADGFVANLPAGTVIGPSSGTYSSMGLDTLNGIESGNPAGKFQTSAGAGYIGVTFQIAGAAHFGYVGYQGTGAENSANGKIFALAYETEPRGAITAGAVPEPASLTMLAAGAAGVAAIRRRAKREQV
jgi:hypothetical protein